MFNCNQYVPVLRCKRAEWLALRELRENDRQIMTPLLEIPSAKFPVDSPDTQIKIDSEFARFAKELYESWGERRFFLDLNLLDSRVRGTNKTHPVTVFWAAAKACSLFPPSPIPVVKLMQDSAYADAVKEIIAGTDVGLCLRVSDDEVERVDFSVRIGELLSFYNLSHEFIDIVVDHGYIIEGESAKLDIAALCECIPDVEKWRSFTVLAGSFPENLAGFKKHGEYQISRIEWTNYRDEIESGVRFKRIPAFGDYTIQHAVYIEPLEDARPSASIRYTAGPYWVIMRGESVSNPEGAQYKQYPAEALMLCERSEFCGKSFSKGDEFIHDKASRMEEIIALPKGETGSVEDWLRVGLNHHLTFTSRQVSNLYESLNDGGL